MSDERRDWKIFKGNGAPHDDLLSLPDPPPWRFARPLKKLSVPANLELDAEASRAKPFLPSQEMILAVNAAFYLRRPLLITGKPGTGKSTLISKVAHELKLGPVLRWPVSSRATVRSGVYEYDAVGRLQARVGEPPPVEQFVTLGPLGTALLADTWPRPLLIDEVDKSDLDFANDLLNVIEEGDYDIPELRRLGPGEHEVFDFHKRRVKIPGGRIECGQFPFVVMTSNGEREFPAPFLRRCVRLHIDSPGIDRLRQIVDSQLSAYSHAMNRDKVDELIDDFDRQRKENQELSTDQLLNAVFLTIATRDASERRFDEQELQTLRDTLLRQLSGPSA